MDKPANDLATRIDDHTIQFVRILPGPIERIWEFLADSDKRATWFARGALPSGAGETFELHWKHRELSPHYTPPPERMAEMDRTGHSAVNTLLKIEPPHLLVFTFGGRKDSPSEVEFRLTQEGPPADNRVRLTLTHSKIPDRDYEISVSGGWHSHLAVLEYRARGETPPAFWDIWRQTDGVYAKR